jgi:iron complex outermembrane receptor protein
MSKYDDPRRLSFAAPPNANDQVDSMRLFRYKPWMRTRVILAIGLSALPLSFAQVLSPRDLIKTDLADLINMEVTSVSKKEQKLSQAGAAIYVITQEDIHRSGATNLPDLLRMVPGVDVAQVDSNTWAITIRGFNGRYANKVLVMIDGRSVYTPSFSGVYWDHQDLPLENIERIEIIRGPGGTVWGANAVNGVINIITKSSKATQGGLVTASGGSHEMGHGLAQYGGTLGSSGAYRVFGDYLNTGSSVQPDGTKAPDSARKSMVGFRSDWEPSQRDTLTVQGDFLHASEGQTDLQLLFTDVPSQGNITNKIRIGAGNVLSRWNHTLSNGSDISLQVYYDDYHRLDQGLNESRDTVDVDFHHHLSIGSRNDVVWGLDYRATSDNMSPRSLTVFLPPSRADNLFSTFVQDEIKLTGTLALTVGSKFEHNAYTGFAYEPSAQLVWTPTNRQTVWLSAARAIRQPSRSDFGLQINESFFPLGPGQPTGLAILVGNPLSKAEELRDYEAGYRTNVGKCLSVDITGFASFFRRVQTEEPLAPYFSRSLGPPLLIFPTTFANLAHARDYGAEIFVNWNATRHWRISPGYSQLHMSVVTDPGSHDTTMAQSSGDSPKNQFQVRSRVDLPHHMEWDSSIGYVGGLRNSFSGTDGNGIIPAYTRLDTNLSWRAGESVEFSLTGQNLLSPGHFEYSDAFQVIHTEVQRRIIGKITWRF